MNQLELLWEYQQADVEADKLDGAMKRSPAKQKLMKLRDFLVEQKNVIARIQSEVVNMIDRMDALKDAIARTDEQLKNLQAKIEAEPGEDAATVRGYIQEANRYINNLNAYEQEIRRIRKDSADRERQEHDIKVRAAKTKAEFDTLKQPYDIEYREMSEKLAVLRAAAAEKAKAVSPEYIEKYNTIKRHSVPPMAKLVNDQCSGCNMSQPSNVLRSIKAGKVVECETCGRMLIV